MFAERRCRHAVPDADVIELEQQLIPGDDRLEPGQNLLRQRVDADVALELAHQLEHAQNVCRRGRGGEVVVTHISGNTSGSGGGGGGA